MCSHPAVLINCDLEIYWFLPEKFKRTAPNRWAISAGSYNNFRKSSFYNYHSYGSPYSRLRNTCFGQQTNDHQVYRIKWCKERRQWTVEQWKNRSLEWRIKFHSVQFGWHGMCLSSDWKTPPARMYSGNCEFRQRWSSAVGSFSWNGTGSMVVITGSLNAKTYRIDLDYHALPTLWQFYGVDRCYFHDDNSTFNFVMSTMVLIVENGVQLVVWPAASADVNTTEHLWDELERRLKRCPHHLTSVMELTCLLETEWKETPLAVVQRLVLGMLWLSQL